MILGNPRGAYHAVWLEVQYGREGHAMEGRGCMGLP